MGKRLKVVITIDKEMSAILRLQDAAEMSERLYQKPLVITYSGGKDSDVLLHLAQEAGIDYEVRHSLTTVDAPQTVHHVRDMFHRLQNDGVKCTVDVHRRPEGGAVTMWNLIVKKGSPPLRISRYCCTELKEVSGKGRFVALGVRWSESSQRSNRAPFEVISKKKTDRVGVMSMDNEQDRQIFESCPIQRQRAVSPIIDWTDEDIWNYIQSEQIETNPLYQEGFSRIGCIGCPLARKQQRYDQFSRWPKYKDNYIAAFDKMLESRKARGKQTNNKWGTNGNEVFRWWMNEKIIEGDG